MSFLSKLGHAAKRVGAAVATGGLTELGGARLATNVATGKDIPVEDMATDPKFLRKLPVIGNLVGDAPMDNPNSIDTGLGYYGAADSALHAADANFAQPELNAQQLYGDARSRANNSYAAGTLGPVDLSGADRLQGEQGQDLWRQKMAAEGKGPSAAQAQYASALSQQKQQALAIANTSRGGGRGAARLQALSNFGGMAGQQAQQSAALRAQEMQSAQQAYTGALAGVRGQDTALATTGAQLGLQRDTNQENANREAFGATNTAQLGYLGAQNAAVNAGTGVAAGRAGVAKTQVELADEQAKAKQKQYELALAKQNAQAGRDAADRQSLTDTGAKVATRLGA